MNAFFGRDIVSTNKDVSTNQKKTWLKQVKIDGVRSNSQVDNDPLKKRIFSRNSVSDFMSLNSDNASSLEGRIVDQNISFLDILTLNK